MVLGTLHSFDVLDDFTVLFPDALTTSAQGTWRYEFTGTTGSISTGPGTNNLLPFVHTETSGSNPIPDVELRGVAHMAVADIPSETSRTLHIRACIQGDFGDGVEGLIVRERASDSDPWVVAGTIHGWVYGTYSAGETVTDENGVDRVIAADGGWIDFAVDVADSTTQIELMPEYIVVGNVWVHDIALRSMQWEWPGDTPGTQYLAMSARSGSPTASFALTTEGQPVPSGYVTGDVLVDTRSSGGSSTLDLPVHSAGDQLIILVGHSYSASPIAQIPVPTGWTAVREGEAGGTSAVGLAAWSKIGDGSESTTTIPAIPAAVPNTVVAIAIAVDDVINIESVALTMQESGVDIDSPSITPSAIATILRAFVFDDNFSSATDYDSDSNFLGVGVGYGESSSPGNGLSVGFGVEEDAAAGVATGTSTWSSDGDSDAGMALTIALTHSVSPPTPTTQQLAMSARGGNPTATFALTTIAPPPPPTPGTLSLAMSARGGNPTAQFALTARPPHVEFGAQVPASIIVAWPSTIATIPVGWSRVAELDDRYIKGQQGTMEPGDTGGSDTHTHSSSSHTHSFASHNHARSGVLTASPASTQESDAIAPTGAVSAVSHTHSLPSGNTGSRSGNVATSASAWGAHEGQIGFVRVIWIESDGGLGGPQGIPDGAWALFDDSTQPTGWIHATGPDTRNRFLKGASAASNGGASQGGGDHRHHTNHDHGIGHTHTISGQSGDATAFHLVSFYPSSSYAAFNGHAHNLSAGSASSVISTTMQDTENTTYEPPYQKQQIIENATGNYDLPLNIICVWLGTLASIPSGWAHCNGTGGTPDLREGFIKGASSLGDIGDTGGSLGHDHGDPSSHTHDGAHDHKLVATDQFAGAFSVIGGGGPPPSSPHGHSSSHGGTTAASGAGATGSGIATVNARADSQPAFRTVAFIQLREVLEIDIDAPTESSVVDTHNFPIDWSLSTGIQQDYRVRIATDALMSTIIYDSGVVVSTSTREETDRIALLNNSELYIRVTGTNTDLVSGASPIRNVTGSWSLPNMVANLVLTPVGGS